MRAALAIILIVSFVGIAAFGIFMMSHERHDGGCVAAAVNGKLCPEVSSMLDFSGFHLDAFRSFVSTVIIFMLTAVFGIIFANRSAPQTPVHKPILRGEPFSEPQSFPLRRELGHWLALHEESPFFS